MRTGSAIIEVVDLKQEVPDLRSGGPPQFNSRPDNYHGSDAVYGGVRAEWLQSLSSSKTDSRCIKMMISFNDTINERSKSMYTSFCES